MDKLKGACSSIPVRAYIVLIVFLSTYINYTTLSNLSVSLPAMVIVKEEHNIPECKRHDPVGYNLTISDTGIKFKWNEDVQGLLLGAWFYGFMSSSLPAGFVVEWYGPFLVLFVCTAISGVLNSLCVVLIPIHWIYFFIARYLIGFAAGFIYPALQCLIARWSPPEERGKFVGALIGNALGVAVTWIIVGPVTKAFKWPWGFHVMSLQIIVYLIILTILTADSPELHKWITPEELAFIKTSQEGKVSKTKVMPPYKAILTSFPFWSLSVLHFGNLWGLNTQITAVPKFMKEVIGFDIRRSGLLSSLPSLVRLFFGIGYGILGDWLKKRKYSRGVLLKVFVVFSHVIPGMLMASMGLVKCNEVAAIVLLVVSMSINGAAVLTNLANATDLSPNFAGTVFGLQSFIAGTTGFIVPSVHGAIITKYGSTIHAWSINFLICGMFYCGCGIFFIIFGTAKLQPWNEKKEDTEAGQSQMT